MVPFLYNRQQRAHSLFLASAEFCNILSRVLSRARSRPAKLYVYINELCTVLKAHSAKKKLNLAPAATTSSEPSGNSPPTDPSLDSTNAETAATEAPRTRGSRRQIQRLEQLLALYVAEIRRLQEKELDLSELDDPDSTYLQEARLKRKLIDPTAVSIVGSYLDCAPCLACSCSRSLSVEASAGPVKGSLTQPQPQVGVPASQSGACASGRLQGGIGLSPPQPAARFSPRAALPQAPRSSVPEDAEGAVQSLGFSVWLCWLGRESGDMAESLALLGPGLLVLSPLAPGGPPWS